MGKSSGGSRNRRDLSEATKKFNQYMKQFEATEFKPLDLSQLQQENVYEDIQVDTTAADYATKQFQQQQANIMQAFKGSAGTSGLSGLAQTLSNQATDFSGKLQANISQQESTGDKLRRQEQSRLQNLMTKYELANQQGASQFEQDKLATMLGVQGQQIAGIRQAIANRQSAQAGMWGTLGSAAIMAMAMPSDKRLKKNIKKIGTSPSGLGIYEFEFKNPKVYGEGRYQGAISDDVPNKFKRTNADGMEEVYYSKIDVDFKKIS